MRSRLDLVKDWEQRAQAAGYSASKMAQGLTVTVRRLQIFFHARFGMSPHEWMLRLRMDHATKLLSTGSSVKGASWELGYKQVSHFSREFKRFFGVSPTSLCFGEINAAELKKRAGASSRLDNKLRL